MTPAPARSRRDHARPARAPRGPRRVSGPVHRRVVPAPAGATTLPRRRTTTVFARVRALPEHRVVDRLLRSRLWIWALGALLGGIVAMQVSLLKLNSGISRAVTTTTTLERQNAALEARIASLSATDRIQTGAQTLGMLMPAAGDVGYLTPGSKDAARAVRRMQPPSDEARALLANNGIEPGSLTAPPVAADPALATATTPIVPAATPDPAAVATPDPAAAVATPDPAATPVVPTTTTTQTSPSGGAVAPQG